MQFDLQLWRQQAWRDAHMQEGMKTIPRPMPVHAPAAALSCRAARRAQRRPWRRRCRLRGRASRSPGEPERTSCPSCWPSQRGAWRCLRQFEVRSRGCPESVTNFTSSKHHAVQQTGWLSQTCSIQPNCYLSLAPVCHPEERFTRTHPTNPLTPTYPPQSPCSSRQCPAPQASVPWTCRHTQRLHTGREGRWCGGGVRVWCVGWGGRH